MLLAPGGQVAGLEATLEVTAPQASRSSSTAHSRQRPQPAATPSEAESSSIERTPERADSRTWRSVMALQRQMYMA